MTVPSTVGPDRSTALATAELDACGADVRAACVDLIGSAIRIGHLLADAKALLPHGAWLPWLAANTPLSRQRAADWMRLASADPAQLAGATGITAALDAVAGSSRAQMYRRRTFRRSRTRPLRGRTRCSGGRGSPLTKATAR
jgi:hypothetical protein